MKRKASHRAVEKYSKTPKANQQDAEFSAEFANNQNENNEVGKKGERNEPIKERA